MIKEKYSLHSIKVADLRSDITRKDIVVPEIQRPFVWKRTQVRDLIDSLYRGYPTGYLIVWQNPKVKLKSGELSDGRKILIDGQQRVTALMAVLLGEPVVNENYETKEIKIAFDPFAAIKALNGEDVEIFKVQDQGVLKSDRWIKDISVVFRDDFNPRPFEDDYQKKNPAIDINELDKVIDNLRGIDRREFGLIQLDKELDIDLVTDIFIRINSKGTALSQGDFVMSKIAADEDHGGNELRKMIDYSAHLFAEPDFFTKLQSGDTSFVASGYLQKIAWVKDAKEDVFNPTCDDIIRVAFMDQYPRAKLSDLVSLLSGRNFETREYEAGIVDATYEKLKAGVLDVVNKNHFMNFMAALKGAGFISPKMVNSRMAMDFAYALYLRLRNEGHNTSSLNKIVQKWYVISVLTGRYSTSPETAFYKDLKLIGEIGVVEALKSIEAATLSDGFWNNAVPQNLRQTSPINPTYQVYLAAQVLMNDKLLFSKTMYVRDLLNSADVHHLFPKAYLAEHGIPKAQYNQNANMAYLNDQINKAIGKKSPNEYFEAAFRQCKTGKIEIGEIVNVEMLRDNLRMNCIPEAVRNLDFSHYDEFLIQRRALMAQKIRKYYENL